jgi:TetR/AcrR family transcriptional regulator, regulator of biofilm formation and stress response
VDSCGSLAIVGEKRRRRPRYGEGREALLRAAIRVVARGGLRQLTYRAVAAEAGVTHGLVAHHFGSREALLEEALRFSIERSVSSSLLEPGTRTVEDFASALAGIVADDPDLQAFQYELLLEARRQPQLRVYADELYETYRSATRCQLKALGADDDALADVIFAALDGLVFQQLATQDAAATIAGLERIRALIRSQASAADK